MEVDEPSSESYQFHHMDIPATSDNAADDDDVQESIDNNVDEDGMVIEESDVEEPTSSSPFVNSGGEEEEEERVKKRDVDVSDNDSLGSPLVPSADYGPSQSQSHQAYPTEEDLEDDTMETEENRILDLTEEVEEDEEEEEHADATEQETSLVEEEKGQGSVCVEDETEDQTLPERELVEQKDDEDEDVEKEGGEKDKMVEDVEEERAEEEERAGDTIEDVEEKDDEDDKIGDALKDSQENGEAGQTEEPECCEEGGGGVEDTAGSAGLGQTTEDTETAGPAHLEEDDPQTQLMSAAVEEPAQQAKPQSHKSKTAVRKKTPTAKKANRKSSPKVTVPTVTVTAPSDQSDDSNPASKQSATALASTPDVRESSEGLPPGWKRIRKLRQNGATSRIRYDTYILSDTGFKMAAFNKLRDYLEKQGLSHYLTDSRYTWFKNVTVTTPPANSRKSSTKVAVPTVKVTAPSDQSDDSNPASKQSAAPLPSTPDPSLPKRIESSDDLPAGWKRLHMLRQAGKTMGRYDCYIISETGFKLRSFNNTRDYLEKRGLSHYLMDSSYDFKFKQPFSTPKEKGGKHSSPATPRTKPLSAEKTNKMTPTTPRKALQSILPSSWSLKKTMTPKDSTSPVKMTLKRKLVSTADGSEGGDTGPQDGSSIWEVKKSSSPAKASSMGKTSPAKARRRNTPGSKKDLPQIRLAGLITKPSSQQAPTPGSSAPQSKFKSSFKTVLQKDIKKSVVEVEREREIGLGITAKDMKKCVVELKRHRDPTEAVPGSHPEPCPDSPSDKSQDMLDQLEQGEATEETTGDGEGQVPIDDGADKVEVISDDDDDNNDDGVKEKDEVSDSAAAMGNDSEVAAYNDDNVESEGVISDVYLAEEQEEPFRSEDDNDDEFPGEETALPPVQNWSECMEEEGGDGEVVEAEGGEAVEKDLITAECSSIDEEEVVEIKSVESDISSAPTPVTVQDSVDQDDDEEDDEAKTHTTDSLTSAPGEEDERNKSPIKKNNKRPLSPSTEDSDTSAQCRSTSKRARVWREEVEEDSSRSVGVCSSDLSYPGGAGGAGGEVGGEGDAEGEDENQNMTTKVQTLHLYDSSSSMRDSASSSSSTTSGSVPPSSSTSFAFTKLLTPPTTSSKAGARASGLRRLSSSTGRRRSRSGSSSVSASETTNTPSASAAAVAVDSSTAGPTCSAHRVLPAVSTNGGGGAGKERRNHRDPSWQPPRSPYNLIQERLFQDPWKLLIVTILMQNVTAEKAIKLLWKFLNRWQYVSVVKGGDVMNIARTLQAMDTTAHATTPPPQHHNQPDHTSNTTPQHTRSYRTAATIVKFSEEYLKKDWTYPLELHGITKYGDDSYRIFCVREWDQVEPDDQLLRNYCQWLRQNHEELAME